MHDVRPEDPLASPALLTQRLGHIPAKSEVTAWMDRWSALDGEYGVGHAARLERAMVQAISLQGKSGFRAAWVIALLSSRGLMVTHPERGLMQAWHSTDDVGCQRECLSALLHLDPSDGALEELLEWATQVVFLDDVPAALLHHALRIMERVVSRPGLLESQGADHEFHEVLRHLERMDRPAHLKKKAALLRARLS